MRELWYELAETGMTFANWGENSWELAGTGVTASGKLMGLAGTAVRISGDWGKLAGTVVRIIQREWLGLG